MGKFSTVCFAWALLCSFHLSAAPHFGYVSYTAYNIGDDAQALAAQQFLPTDAVPIDREFTGIFSAPYPVYTIINGWFMHTKDFCWYRPDVPAPAKSWPPATCINPLIISLHLAEGFLPFAFTDEAVAYLKANGPVGARDLNTLRELQERNIPSYFSACLTLTLENDYKGPRNNVIYAVDLDDESYEYLKAHTASPVERVSHIIDLQTVLDPEKRLEYTKKCLESYKRAKGVVTVRLHAAMPCLAFETPVLFINPSTDRRCHGLRELARHCSKEEFLKGDFDFDFDNPRPNPVDYTVYRKQLTETVKDWVAQHMSE